MSFPATTAGRRRIQQQGRKVRLTTRVLRATFLQPLARRRRTRIPRPEGKTGVDCPVGPLLGSVIPDQEWGNVWIRPSDRFPVAFPAEPAFPRPNDSEDSVLLKAVRTGKAMQRIVPVATARGERFQAWFASPNWPARGVELCMCQRQRVPAGGRSPRRPARRFPRTIRHTISAKRTWMVRPLLAALTNTHPSARRPPVRRAALVSVPRACGCGACRGVPRRIQIEAPPEQLAHELSHGTEPRLGCADPPGLPGFLITRGGRPVRVEFSKTFGPRGRVPRSVGNLPAHIWHTRPTIAQ